jgi:peptide/nickel transport system permease protein
MQNAAHRGKLEPVNATITLADDALVPRRSLLARSADAIRRNPTIFIGAVLLAALVAVALLAPVIAADPFRQAPINRMRPPSERWWFGTDQFGRDVFARTIYGTRVSLTVGISVALFSSFIGLIIGLACGYFRALDAVLMRVMDGLMAIPSILLAIALITLTRPGLGIVIVAIVIPEVPRVARVVRSVVLSIRSQPYVESAVAGGTRSLKLLARHILPNTLAPLIVQATYVCASAMLIEAGLSFLGAGVPPEIPSWGNIIAQGRTFFQIAPWSILIPGAFLALTVLAVNMLGDGMRDRLDPRLARRM